MIENFASRFRLGGPVGFNPISRPFRSIVNLDQGGPIISRSVMITSDGKRTTKQESRQDENGNVITTTTVHDNAPVSSVDAPNRQVSIIRAQNLVKSVLEDIPVEFKDLLGLSALGGLKVVPFAAVSGADLEDNGSSQTPTLSDTSYSTTRSEGDQSSQPARKLTVEFENPKLDEGTRSMVLQVVLTQLVSAACCSECGFSLCGGRRWRTSWRWLRRSWR
mmetsp:Transcript_69543/g.185487  ORF Transcript_69543/g.185487 Transcript_69543/m.185487 type:complete len:220 (+) Transcript_69543:446-1105(+)